MVLSIIRDRDNRINKIYALQELHYRHHHVMRNRLAFCRFYSPCIELVGILLDLDFQIPCLLPLGLLFCSSLVPCKDFCICSALKVFEPLLVVLLEPVPVLGKLLVHFLCRFALFVFLDYSHSQVFCKILGISPEVVTHIRPHSLQGIKKVDGHIPFVCVYVKHIAAMLYHLIPQLI